MRFMNLTPHTLTFRNLDGDVRLEASGIVARVGTTVVPLRTVGGMLLRAKSLGQVQNLPDPDGETVYVVSGMVLEALRASGSRRGDVVAPATGPNDEAVRDASGHVIAVTQLDGLA